MTLSSNTSNKNISLPFFNFFRSSIAKNNRIENNLGIVAYANTSDGLGDKLENKESDKDRQE
jgi:hypothetical protein